MLEQSPGVLPKSLLGEALTYLREPWPKLLRYVENGSWPISNNPCENSIRPFCVGRRGGLFQRLPLAKTVDDYDALLPWRMPADLRRSHFLLHHSHHTGTHAQSNVLEDRVLRSRGMGVFWMARGNAC